MASSMLLLDTRIQHAGLVAQNPTRLHSIVKLGAA